MLNFLLEKIVKIVDLIKGDNFDEYMMYVL